MFEIDKFKFGAFVSELRKEKGYTQKDLAERLFISDKAISKWETGMSIPDITLLIPLSNLLDVSVTELLMCERIDSNSSIDAEKVENVIKTALTYSEEKATRAYQTKTKWPIVYLCALVIEGLGLLLCLQNQLLSEPLQTVLLLSTIFGAYFCFMVKTQLSVFYDENKCGLYYDGPVRMNMPGVSLNNSNWPHIVRVSRMSLCLLMAAFPFISLMLATYNLSERTESFVLLIILLTGLFLPIYVVGKKYE